MQSSAHMNINSHFLHLNFYSVLVSVSVMMMSAVCSSALSVTLVMGTVYFLPSLSSSLKPLIHCDLCIIINNI